MEEIPQKEYDILNCGFNEKGELYFDIRVVVPKDNCTTEFKADIAKSKLVNNPMFNFKLVLLPDNTTKLSRTLKEGMSDEEAKKFLELLR